MKWNGEKVRAGLPFGQGAAQIQKSPQSHGQATAVRDAIEYP